MDPATAIGIASSILQIVQFSLTTVSQVKEICQSSSGALRENEKLTEAACALQKSHADLERQSHEIPDTDSDQDAELRALAMRIAVTVGEFRTLLDSLKAKRKRDAFWKTLQSRYKRDEIERLRRELELQRSTLDSRILIDLRSRLQKASKQQSVSMKNLGGRLDALHVNISAMRKTDDSFSIESAWKAAKDSLFFPEIYRRQDNIAQAHETTFNWVLAKDPGPKATWDNFVNWLETGSGVYWIRGKVGSGKSTLMSFIYSKKKTMDHLNTWSAGLKLVTANFFFWNAGTTLEMSQAGLCRSLLYQILEQMPHLAAALFPELDLAQLKTLNTSQARDMYWTERRLFAALDRIKSLPEAPTRFCFFIDGLDELSGRVESLRDWIISTAATSHIKICASSRPWPVFEDAFMPYPKLSLHDLTHDDINRFIHAAFGSNDRYLVMQSQDANETRWLEEEISHKASGVFMWVKLVTIQLRGAIDNGDGMDQLREILDEFPPELDGLYRKMLVGPESRYHKEVLDLLSILLLDTARGLARQYGSFEIRLCDTLKLAGALGGTPVLRDASALQHPIPSRQDLAKRLTSLGKGLVEVAEVTNVSSPAEACQNCVASLSDDCATRKFHGMPDSVQFAHKSVMEWLLRATDLSLLSARQASRHLLATRFAVLQDPVANKLMPRHYAFSFFIEGAQIYLKHHQNVPEELIDRAVMADILHEYLDGNAPSQERAKVFSAPAFPPLSHQSLSTIGKICGLSPESMLVVLGGRLHAAINAGLASYVLEKVKTFPGFAMNNQIGLLQLAAGRLFMEPMPNIEIQSLFETALTLLSQGSDPNEPEQSVREYNWNPYSPWTRLLRSNAYRIPSDFQQRAACLNTIEEFIIRGASLDACTELVYQRTVGAEIPSCVREFFGPLEDSLDNYDDNMEHIVIIFEVMPLTALSMWLHDPGAARLKHELKSRGAKDAAVARDGFIKPHPIRHSVFDPASLNGFVEKMQESIPGFDVVAFCAGAYDGH